MGGCEPVKLDRRSVDAAPRERVGRKKRAFDDCVLPVVDVFYI